MLPISSDVTVKLSPKAPAAVDAIVVLVHKETKPADVHLPALDERAAAVLVRLLRAGLVKGKSNEVTTHLVESARSKEGKPAKEQRLIVIGMGNPKTLSLLCWREAGTALARAMRKQEIESAALILAGIPDSISGLPGVANPQAPGGQAVEAFAGAVVTGSFDFQEYKGTASKVKSKVRSARTLTIVGASDLAADVARGVAIAEGQNFARTIASRPGNDINPLTLAKVAQELAREAKLSCHVLDEKQMARLGMGGMLAVGAGSIYTPPRMIVLEYRGDARKSEKTPLLVVGKAITFDTGGISIKPAEKMGRMIYDKCGGMAVLGLMYALAKLKLKVNVVGILAAAENHVSSRAYRPGDILRMYNGVTVEVTNTDAEGRLVLGDAMAWGIETYKPSSIVDLATLTGGVSVALGRTMAGVMSNSDDLVQKIINAGVLAGEKMWRLPIGDEQREQIKSDHADIVNSAGRDAHPLQGGAFLSHFVPDDGSVPWAHLDIAAVADTEKDTALYGKGPTGWGVRTLVEWVRGGR